MGASRAEGELSLGGVLHGLVRPVPVGWVHGIVFQIKNAAQAGHDNVRVEFVHRGQNTAPAAEKSFNADSFGPFRAEGLDIIF